MSRIDELKSQIAQCEEIIYNPRSGVRKIFKATVQCSQLTTELIEEENRLHKIEMEAMHTRHEAKTTRALQDYEDARNAPMSLDFSSLTVEDLYGGPLPPHLKQSES